VSLVIVFGSTVLYWFRCDSCGYESADYGREVDADLAAARHVCPVPPPPLFELDETGMLWPHTRRPPGLPSPSI
jgi:hypothetical protein